MTALLLWPLAALELTPRVIVHLCNVLTRESS